MIATGTKPAVSAKVPINGRNIINSDQILEMPEIPKTLIVVGGGVIGVEYTCMFATLGVRVILVEKRPRLLEFADAEMVEALSYHLRDIRVTMRLNEEVASVEETAGRRRGSEPGEQEEAFRRRAAIRRRPAGQRGRSEPGCGRPRSRCARPHSRWMPNYRTKQPHIFAVGDVIGFPSLASVSMEQGRIAAARAFNMPGTPIRRLIPTASIRFRKSPSSAKPRSSLPTKTFPTRSASRITAKSRAGQIRGDTTGRLKLIFHRETVNCSEFTSSARAPRIVAHRPGGDDSEGHSGILRRHRVQLSDSGGMLQSRGV